MKKRVGLFGGMFDPVHNGHISIARSFLNSNKIDELWVLLTPFPPHKEGINHAYYYIRQEMLMTGFAGFQNLEILTIEHELPKPSYSFYTIQYLKEQYPDFDFFCCIGGDNLSKFHTWKFYDKILEEVGLLVTIRPRIDHSSIEKDVLKKTTFVDHEPIEVASSLIKDLVQSGQSINDLVPEAVIEIIDREKLYR